MKNHSVRINNRERTFEIGTPSKLLTFLLSKTELKPSMECGVDSRAGNMVGIV